MVGPLVGGFLIDEASWRWIFAINVPFVLVTLALATQPFVAAAGLSGFWELLGRSGTAWAAVLMPAGFFLSAAGRGRTRPNRLIALVWAGAALLAASVLTLGIGLLV